MSYYLGLDNGGTTTKASLYTREGLEVRTESIETTMITPRPGFTERDMEEMWRANCRVIRRVLDTSGIRPAEIAAVAVCGHGKGLYLWDKTGGPAYRGIVSTDNRAWSYSEKWKTDGTEQSAFRRSCQKVMACQPVALLRWMIDHEPDIPSRVQWVFECKDYIRFRLTGCANAELTDYSGANVINLHTCKYDDELLRLFGIERFRDAFPPLCRSTEICGTVTREAAAQIGLLEGTPVAAGMFDIDACALAVNLTDQEHICMIAGTWSINEYIRETPVLDGSVMMNSLFCIPGYYLVEECSPTSAGNYEWYIQTLLPELAAECKRNGASIYEQTSKWVEELPASELCPVFLPFLLASNVHPNAMGAFVGLSNYHTRAHLTRSVFEGIAFSHRYHLENLMKTKQETSKSIRLAGGAARSAVWAQMFADVTHLPVETVQAKETGTLGCAMAAAVAVGEYSDLADAAKHMTHLSEAILPRQENGTAYDRKYQMYRKVIDALDCVWDDMQALK